MHPIWFIGSSEYPIHLWIFLDWLTPDIGISGSCQGVIALNMEDGTLHRFRAASTILATGVLYAMMIIITFVLTYKLCKYNSMLFAGLWQSIFLRNLCSHMHGRWKCHGCTCRASTWGLSSSFLVSWKVLDNFSSPFLQLFFPLLAQDLEFVQFHPTGIYGAGCLITEGLNHKFE